MAAIDQLINELRADGSIDSQGKFTLDREQARAKMQKFQLVDARRYVLELVQSAILRDATKLEFEIDADDMRLRFDGLAFTHAELDDLYGSLFGEGDSRPLRGLRQLALALNAALGMEPRHIRLRSGDVELRMAPGQRDEILVHDQAVTGTEIHVRQRLRMRVFVDFFLNLAGRIAEEQYLRQRCEFSTVPVVLEGKQLNAGLAVPERGLASLTVDGKDFRGDLKIVDREEPCELRLVKDGVWIDSKPLPGCGTHLIAVVEGDNLRKDVSQARIVETAALERIVAALKTTRWRLWKLANDQLVGPELQRARELIRVQLLDHAERDELRDNADAQALAQTVIWIDARDSKREVNLAELVEHVVAQGVPRFCKTPFPELEADGDPIVLLDDPGDKPKLERLLGRELVEAENLLALQRRRMLGHRAWLGRAGKPELPTHVSFAARGQIRLELDSGPVRGEIGVDALTLTDTSHSAPVHLFMFKDGCLLGRAELDLGLPNLWLAIDAGFEPNFDYTDADRNSAFIAILLHGLAAMRGPWAALLELLSHPEVVAHVRGLIKRWLIALIDPASQRALLTRAGADVSREFFMATAELLPGLDIDSLLGESAADDPLTAAALFEPLVGPRLSLARLGQIVSATGKLRYVESRPEDPRLKEPDVVFLGPGDRKIVRALFGEGRLEKWDTTAKQRELEFWDSEQMELERIEPELERGLAASGVDARNWIVRQSEGPARTLVLFRFGGDGDFEEIDGLGTIEVGVRYEGRLLCEVELEGVGPIMALVEHPGLSPTHSWDDVVRDAAYDEAIAAVHAAARELVRRACAGFEDEAGPGQRWLARVLLHGAARDRELRSFALHVPLLSTVDGKTLSLAQASELMREHGRLDHVSRELGWAPVDDPPVIYAEGSELDDLREVVGDALVDASARVRHHRAFELLADRPPLREAKLDRDLMLVCAELRGQDQVGEIGIPRGRASSGLSLTFGLAGREVGELIEHVGFFVPVDAVVIDEQLPLDAEGQVEIGNKRVRTLVRQCRRRVSALIEALARRWPELDGDARDQAWSVLLSHLRHEAGQDRGKAREQAFDAAAAVPGFSDVRGRWLGLTEVRESAGSRPLDVLSASVHGDVRVDLPELDRLILIVLEHERECLEAYADVRCLDDVWADELAALQAFASAPKVETPNIHEVAIAYRKAAVAGGLECELWLPRSPSPFEFTPSMIFTVAEREVGRGLVGDALPSAGIVRGDGLEHLGGEVVLDDRQIFSLERQQVIMYTELAARFAADRVAQDDRERALEYLAWVAHHLDDPDALRSHGKHAIALRKATDQVVPPALRRTVGRWLGGRVEPEVEPAKPDAAEQPPSSAPTKTEVPSAEPPAAEPAPQARVEPIPDPTTPEQRLLAAVYEQLHWARARHDLLDELLLNHLEIRAWGAGEIATMDRNTLALNRDHPIVARLLGQARHDAVDLTFLIAALYSLLNYEAEEITDDHERTFVGQLAESLAVASQAQRGP